MKRNRELITDNSPLFTATNIPLLLNTYIEELEDRVNIYVPNTGHKGLLEDKVKQLHDFFKKGVVFLVDESIQNKKKHEAISKPEKKGQLLGKKFLVEEYIETPYFLGASNEFAFKTTEEFIQAKEGILFVYGSVGAGKSHLLHLMAYRMLEKRKDVYINSARDFHEEMKSFFDKSKKIYDFIINFKYSDCLIIDDFQYFNIKELAYTYDIIFDILNTIMENRKRAVFSSDVSPYLYQFMPDRIKSRLLSGFVAELKPPDSKIKRQYIEFFSRKHRFVLDEDIILYLIANTENLRELKLFLNICEAISGQETLNLAKLKSKIPRDIREVKSLVKKNVFQRLYTIMQEYYKVSIEDFTKQKRPRNVGKLDSLVYYLCQNHLDLGELRMRLKINAKHHGYYLDRGEKLFQELPDDVKGDITNILAQYK